MLMVLDQRVPQSLLSEHHSKYPQDVAQLSWFEAICERS